MASPLSFSIKSLPLLLALCVTGARAAPLAVEPFFTGGATYADTAAINGQNVVSTGFAGAWSGSSTLTATASGLSGVPGSFTAFGGAATSATGATVTRQFSPAVVTTLSTATEVWFSFLYRSNHSTGASNLVGLISAADPDILASVGQRTTGVRATLRDSTGSGGSLTKINGGGVSAATIGDAYTSADTGIGLWLPDTTYLMVCQVSINRTGTNAETLRFWKLTDVASFDVATPFLTVNRDILNTTYPGFTGVVVQGTQTAPGVNIYDEIRVGLAYGDVLPSAFAGIPEAFSTTANPAGGWSHGVKASPLASSIDLFPSVTAADATAPAQRWTDPDDPAEFAGLVSTSVGGFSWGGGASDWEAGRIYHAWKDSATSPIVSRFTVGPAGTYDLTAAWTSHTVAGAAATVSIVVNGSTYFSGDLSGFAGSTAGTPTPSGTVPSVNGSALSVSLPAGARVDFVTLPVSARGNVSLAAAVTPRTAAPLPVTTTVVINEFCADNVSTLKDADKDYSDWIEIYNGTGAPVDITGWSLTDEIVLPAKWVFPARLLAPGEHLVVFASSKDALKRPAYNSTSQLHTNFKLANTGEYLGLYNAAGQIVDAFNPTFPAQYPDLAFGRGSNSAALGFLAPTPGAPNSVSTALHPVTLAFSAPSGLFTGSLSVSITGQLAGHVVRYTTNGTEPTLANGNTYTTTPISVSGNTTLKARVYSDSSPGPLSDANYTLRGTATQYGITPATFVSSLPILIIDADSSTATTSRVASTARFTLIDRSAVDQKARLTDTPALATRGSIKLRGQSSAGLTKKGYGIEFWDAGDQDKALPVLGMPAESDWVLYASYQYDTDFMRNTLMYELYNRIGRYAPRTRFVEVFFNPTGASVDGADYYGVYVLMEKIKVDKNRVDITKITPLDNAGEELTGGYIIAHDKGAGTEWIDGAGGLPNWLHTADTMFIVKQPSVTDITAQQKAYLTDYLTRCDAAIGASNFRHPTTGLSYTEYIGRDSFIDHHMMMAFAKNVDALRVSFYLQKDRGGKLNASCLWDFDRSMDADTEPRDNNPAMWNPDNDTVSSDFFSLEGRAAEGWFNRLHLDPDYMQAWVDRYARWRTTGILDTTAINLILDAKAAELTALDNGGADTPIARNFYRWPRTIRSTSTSQTNAATVIFGSNAGSELSNHKLWIQNRLAFMDTFVLAKPAASVAAGIITPTTDITLTSADSSGGTFYYTTDGSDPRATGGGIAAGAATYGSPIRMATSGFVTARLRKTGLNPTAKHTEWSAPLQLYYTVGATPASSADLRVSELMYHPADPSPAEIAAGFTDSDKFEYIELLNAGAGTINLYGAKFTSGVDFNFSNAAKPALLQMAPGERILVVKNLAAFTLRYGATAAALVIGEFAGNDNLNNAGETITIVASNLATILSFTYGDTAPWPTEADGLGSSLVLSGANPSDPLSWRIGGGPGVSDTTTIAAWKTLKGIVSETEDTDGDGLSALLEYATGGDPAIASLTTLPVITTNPDGTTTVVVSKRLDADGVTFVFETADTLGTWTPLAGTLQTRTFSNGREILTYSYPAEANTTARFHRVAFVIP